uniref:Ig-like domain-containing protein n=1 Tax=Calidris pygmaea TaxID=425635 RepID=A0A8C3KRL8_9CHAR
ATPSPERPTVRVSGKEGDGFLTLHCRAYGFYPRPISVSWLKDGEVRDQETERGGTVPNSDGTYYTWVSIEANPGEKDKYRCRVEHASLPEAEVYAWGEPGGLGHGEGRGGVVPLPLEDTSMIQGGTEQCAPVAKSILAWMKKILPAGLGMWSPPLYSELLRLHLRTLLSSGTLTTRETLRCWMVT